MHEEIYKQNIKEALKNLIKVNNSIFDSLIPISLHGELKEWNDTISVGESFKFDFAIFKNSEDTNIKHLVKLIEQIDETFETIKNINCIELDEKQNSR